MFCSVSMYRKSAEIRISRLHILPETFLFSYNVLFLHNRFSLFVKKFKASTESMLRLIFLKIFIYWSKSKTMFIMFDVHQLYFFFCVLFEATKDIK